jgi:Pectate lyase superfamily protein
MSQIRLMVFAGSAPPCLFRYRLFPMILNIRPQLAIGPSLPAPARLLACLLIAASPAHAQSWRSSLYPENWTPPVDLSFAKDKMIQDFSYAGYRRGEVEIPTPDTRVLDAVRQYGADPSGKTDSTAAIQKALDAAGKAGGGVVLLPPGTFRISLPNANSSSVLRISKNNTILRGSGVGKTFLLNYSRRMRSKAIVYVRGNDRTTPVSSRLLTKDVLTPVKRLDVGKVSGFAVGDIISVRWNFTRQWIAEHGQSAVWKPGVSAPSPAVYQREIMAVNAAEGWIETDIPARYYHRLRDKARVEKYNSRIQECGIEGLSIGNVQHPGKGWQSDDCEVRGTGGYDVHASWVIHFSRARNCWVRDVHSYQAEGNSSTCHILSNGIQIGISSNITLRNCSMMRPQYGGSGGNGYMFRLTNGNDCLMDQCIAEFSRHGFVNSHAGSSGNVFHKCEDRNTRSSTGDTGYVRTGGDGSDNHMHFSHSSLWDQCHARESWWEAVHRGWNNQALAAAHCVYWNTSGSGSSAVNGGKIVRSGQARYGYVIGTQGQPDGIELRTTGNSLPLDIAEGEGRGGDLVPQSLYEDQLARRMKNSKTNIPVRPKDLSDNHSKPVPPGSAADHLMKTP